MTMNIGQMKENQLKPIYSKKKIKISQPKSKIYITKQIQENVKNKIIHRNDKNILKKEQIVNFNLNKNINNKNRNNNEHYGIMTLSSNISESSIDADATNEEKKEYNIISPKINKQKVNHINKINENIIKEKSCSSEDEKNEINNKQNELNKEKKDINDKNGNKEFHVQGKREKKNDLKKDNNNSIKDNYLKLSNGKKAIPEEIYNDEYYSSREIIVKDVSTRDKRINVYIKYIDNTSFKHHNQYNNKLGKKHLLIIFQTDTIYIPQAYSSILEKRSDNYKRDKFYKNMNDKNHQYKLNKILSSIIEEEEKSKAAGSVNNSVLSEEDNLKNGNFSYFFIQSIIYFIGFLHSIFSDKKKALYFHFFKILKKIKNESFLKGLISQKMTQTLNKLKEEEKKDKNNTFDDVLLYNINDNSVDINFISKVKNENKNPKNNAKDLRNATYTFDEKFSTQTNFCQFIDDNVYKLSNSNKKTNMNLSMDNFYLNKKGTHKLNKNIIKQKINNTEINKTKKIYVKEFKDWEKIGNGIDHININENRDEESKDNNLCYKKNITLSEACNKLSEVIYDFRISLMKYGMRKIEKID